MIEATCTACGTVNRVAEADVPAGAKFVSCSNCRARVALPAATAADAGLELADLPAPRRASPLAGASAPSRPPPRVSLDFDDDLLGPSGASAPGAPPASAAAAPAPFDLGPELPVPKRGKPPTDAPASLGVDLPAPKSKYPPPRPPSMPLPSLGARPPAVPPSHPTAAAKTATGPVGVGGLADLPAPKAKASPDLPAPKARAVPDLPAPKAASLFGDLPMPRPPAPPAAAPLDLGNLPMPRPPAPPAAAPLDLGNLPMPRPPAPPAAAPLDLGNLPVPKGGEDLPAPKGFFDDLPQPARGGAATPTSAARPELPAPKGFFDDLPQPARGGASVNTDLPAPKGFFDDLPGKVSTARAEAQAPKGFFDDSPAAPPPAPGFFDDLPQPSKHQPGSALAPRSAAPGAPLLDLDGDLGSELADLNAAPPLDLALEGGSSPSLDIQMRTPEPALPAKGQFDDLDLSKPTAQSGRSETTKQRALERDLEGRGRAAETPKDREPLPPVSFGKPAPGTLELEEPRLGVTPTLGPKKAKVSSETEVQQKLRRSKRTKLAAIAAAGVLVLGAGGFVMYRRHAAAVARTAEIDTAIRDARRALDSDAANHWQRAASAAARALELDKLNPAALGLRAEAQYASAFAEGTDAQRRIATASTTLSNAARAAVTGPEILRAQALQALADHQSDVAVTKLTALAQAAPNDGRLQLYLGWAQTAAGDIAAASAAFGKAAATKGLEVPALYGRGRALLAAGDIEGARKDFGAVLAVAKEHVGAQVGLAAAEPAAQAAQQESDLLAILQRKDLDTADPRAVTEAWVLAGNAAARSGRLSDARERYRGGLKLSPDDVPARTGLAAVELRDGKLDTAAEEIGKAVAQNKEDVKAQLVAAEIEIAQKKFPLAAERLRLLASREPPPAKADASRLQLVTGHLLEAQGKPLEAVDAYEQAATLAGDRDLEPAIEAAQKLAALAETAPPEQAATLRARADKLLTALSAAATKDAALAQTLGTAYLQAGDAAKAESWLRAAVAARPDNQLAKFQLARTLEAIGKSPEAIEILTAIIDADPKSAQEGIELARIYEAAERIPEASALYDRLLAAQPPSIELRSRAGRLFARSNQIAKAAELGKSIVAESPDNAAGLYLAGEGLLAAGQAADAKKLFAQAAAADHEAQYLEAQGRASERMDRDSGQTSQQDAAIRAYTEAHQLAPTMTSPLVALGRLYLAQHQPTKALEPLTQAITLVKGDPYVALLMGMVSNDLHDSDKATEWFEASRAARPSAEAAYQLGILYRDANKAGEAAARYGEAVRLARADEQAGQPRPPWLLDAYYGLGAVLLGRDDRAAAQAWKTYIDLNPKPSAQVDEVERNLATSLKRYL